MTTETVLAPSQIDDVAGQICGTMANYRETNFARAIEQAVLQSPEVKMLREDSERLGWLQERAHDSSHAAQIRLLRDPAINAGVNRIEVRTGCGSGVWERASEGHNLRAAIDAAMEKQP